MTTTRRFCAGTTDERLDDDPLRPARGCVLAMLMALAFWSVIALLVLAAR